jgi:hypothetical protein
MEVLGLAEKIIHLSRKGAEINLDLACLHSFKKQNLIAMLLMKCVKLK